MRKAFSTDRATLWHGDCARIASVIAPESIDAIVTDPPAGISFMGKAWDDDKGGRDQWVAWLRDVMRTALGLLKPGGHALVWALPRTSHWTATAIEDAGFEIRDVVVHLFGTGFPKSLDVSKAIDAAAGATREVVGLSARHGGGHANGPSFNVSPDVPYITAPATPDAARFAGYGTSLKPGYEGWVLARKPIAILDAVRMVDGCLSSLYASIAVEDSASSRVAQPENPRPASAAKPAGKRRATSGGSSAAMDTSPSASAIASSLSIVSSWRRTLAECSDLASMFTTAMASGLITDLQTLNSSASRITPASIILAASNRDGLMSPVLDVARRFVALQAKCDAIQILTATASAGPSEDDSGNSESPSRPGGSVTLGDTGSDNWILARKPLAGTVAENVLRYGTGALNIDACRIGTTENLNGGAYSGERREATSPVAFAGRGIGEHVAPTGRWPAHVTLAHSPGCELVGTGHEERQVMRRTETVVAAHSMAGTSTGATGTGETFTNSRDVYRCAPGCAVAALDAQSGTLKSGGGDKGGKAAGGGLNGTSTFAIRARAGEKLHEPNTGGASRFFYVAKATRAEKDAGLDHLPLRTGGDATDREEGSAGLNSPRAGSGRMGGVRNHHPTVKSIALMRWLCRLITPPGGIVLDLFAGSGTTGLAALAEGLRFVGVEREAEFVDVAAGRLAHVECVPVPELTQDGAPKAAPAQPSLFDAIGGGR